MTEKTFQARVLLVGSGILEEDLGEKRITIVSIVEHGRDAGFYAHVDHDGQTVSGRVAGISPPDWERTGVKPIVRVSRSAGG
jgi:hypothetical protein